MLFSQVIAADRIKKQLVDMVQTNRLGHALLFLGNEGCGSLPLAIALAQFISCEKIQRSLQPALLSEPSLFGELMPSTSPIYYNDACNECASCLKARQFGHPDIHFTFPVIPKKAGDKPKSKDFGTEWREFLQLMPYGNKFDWLQFIKAENKQGNITAEECQEINRQLNMKSFENRYKILILWMPEYLGKEGNKLLKLIEEPPLDTLFILVAENEENVLPTIVSRCQLIKIPSLSVAELEAALISKNKTETNIAHQAAVMAQGSYRAALQILQDSNTDYLEYIRSWLNAALFQGPKEQVQWVEDLSKVGREQLKQVLSYFLHLCEVAVRMQLMGILSDFATPQENDFLQKFSKMCPVSSMAELSDLLDKSIYHIERNANLKILLLGLTIKIYHLIKNKTLLLTN
jgi:DNA polymerase-3 subunit delta'